MGLFLKGVTYHWYAHLDVQIGRYNSTAFDEVTNNLRLLGWKVEHQEWSLLTDRYDLLQMFCVLKIATVVPSEPVLLNLSLLFVVQGGENENESLYKHGVTQAYLPTSQGRLYVAHVVEALEGIAAIAYAALNLLQFPARLTLVG